MSEHKTVEEFLERAFSYGKSQNSRMTKKAALQRFQEYLNGVHSASLDNIPNLPTTDPIELLDGFVFYMDQKGLSKRSIKNYISTAKQWLRFNKIKIDSEEFRD